MSANPADVIRDVIMRVDGIDNGHCRICGRYRKPVMPSTAAETGNSGCENSECPSHKYWPAIVALTGRDDDRLPANAEWVGTFAIQRRAYPDQFILDEISSDYYLRFDCSPLEGQEEPDCSVLLHVLPPTDEQAAVLIYHATRGDVRRLLDVLKVIPKKLDRP